MVQIVPFKGVYYNQEKIKDLRLVTAPPYDAISPAQQEELYQKSPYNVVRLILNKNEAPKKYQEPAQFLRQWLDEEILISSEKPALYLYEQKYHVPQGKKDRIMIRRGIIARARLEDFSSGKILPHEKTHKSAKVDRLNLMKECKANLSQIFSFYSDQEGIVSYILEQTITKETPFVDVKDENEVEHRLWEITEPNTIKTICQQIENCPIFIADGHHRYETSLKYRNLCRQEDLVWNEDKAYNFTSMMLVNMDDADLTILPIHRLIRHLKHFDLEQLKEILEEYFALKEFKYTTGEESKAIEKLLTAMHHHDGRHRFGMYGGNDKLYLLTLKSQNILSQIKAKSYSAQWAYLDVTVLHDVLIDHILKAGEQEWGEEHITYTIDAKQAMDLVNQRQYQLAIFLNPTRIEQVKAIAHAGEKMPQKSTFFYPKLLSGLIINHLED